MNAPAPRLVRRRRWRPLAAFAALAVVACSSGSPPAAPPANTPGDAGAVVPELGTEATRRLTVVGTAKDGLASPRDLAFDPESPSRLWTVNEKTNGTVVYFDPGSPSQRVEARVDRYAEHFMARPSSLAFGAAGRFATCQESRDEWNDAPQPPDDFMGPTLWPSDLAIFAKVGQAFPLAPGQPEGSHLDMLHQSPLCMGIAHERDGVYWAFDGKNGEIVRYDFQKDHGPGGSDHTDGVVRRYTDAKVTRVDGVASHMALDKESGWLYVADTGAGRVMRLDTRGGTSSGKLTGANDRLAEYSGVVGAVYQVFVDGLSQPSGIELAAGRVLVTDYAAGRILAYSSADRKELGRVELGRKGVMGIALGPDGKLWFVDRDANLVVRVDP